MLVTHPSHFGLEMIGNTSTSVVFQGSLADCRRMAFAHGMEIAKYEGRTISINSGHAIMAPASENSFSLCWFKEGGMIAKTQDAYALVIPKRTYEKPL